MVDTPLFHTVVFDLGTCVECSEPKPLPKSHDGYAPLSSSHSMLDIQPGSRRGSTASQVSIYVYSFYVGDIQHYWHRYMCVDIYLCIYNSNGDIYI